MCPCVQVKECNTVVYRGCRVVIVVGKVPAEGWAEDRIPVAARFSAPVQTGPGAHPTSCTMGSSVGIATAYGLDGPGIESRWVRDLTASVQTGPGAHPTSCTMGSSVGIATAYGLDGPRIEFRWVRDLSASVQTGPGAHPASCTMGTGSFPGVKSGRGVLLNTHPFLVLRSWNSRAIPLLTLRATTGL